MLAYRTTRCPYCGAKIEIMKPYSINDYGNDLGEPYSYCLSCGGKYKTGKQRWSQMSIFRKAKVVLKLIFNIIISSFIFGVFLLVFVYLLKKYIFYNAFDWIEIYDFGNLILITALILSPFITVGRIINLSSM